MKHMAPRSLLGAIRTFIAGRGGLALVCAAAAIALGIGIGSAKLSCPFSDPFAHIRAQDEAVYANSSMYMAGSGHWITPRFLGRFLLYKPPLLIWLAAASIKLFGADVSALRLPSLIAAVLATVVLFSWCRNARSSIAGLAVVTLLFSNPLWHVFARLCYTDMIWACLTTCALACVFVDPQLARRKSLVMFAVAIGLSIMVKNVAGLLPAIVVLLQNALVPRESRVPLRALLKSAAIVFVVSAPWHLYQAIRHPQWFWMDYIHVQLLGFGLKPPAQSSTEVQLSFYLTRLVMLDPALTCIAVVGLVTCVYCAIRRERLACLLIVWIAVGLALLSVFQYRNLPYVLMLIPPLALVGSIYGIPFGAAKKYSGVAVAVLACVFVVKAVNQDAVWGLKWGRCEPLPAVAAIDSYVQMARPNDLVLAGANDEFYSATVGLPKVRYYFLDPADVVINYAPHYAELGITLTVDQLEHLDHLEASYARSLQAWGLSSTYPIGTALVSRTPDGLARLLAARPDWDVLGTSGELSQVSSVVARTHETVPLPNGYVAVLSRQTIQRPSPSAAFSRKRFPSRM